MKIVFLKQPDHSKKQKNRTTKKKYQTAPKFIDQDQPWSNYIDLVPNTLLLFFLLLLNKKNPNSYDL